MRILLSFLLVLVLGINPALAASGGVGCGHDFEMEQSMESHETEMPCHSETETVDGSVKAQTKNEKAKHCEGHCMCNALSSAFSGITVDRSPSFFFKQKDSHIATLDNFFKNRTVSPPHQPPRS
tara:strand:- start:314 stop:685 length:372 start_codon:yes stop_codon:yes gene_type:complete